MAIYIWFGLQLIEQRATTWYVVVIIGFLVVTLCAFLGKWWEIVIEAYIFVYGKVSHRAILASTCSLNRKKSMQEWSSNWHCNHGSTCILTVSAGEAFVSSWINIGECCCSHHCCSDCPWSEKLVLSLKVSPLLVLQPEGISYSGAEDICGARPEGICSSSAVSGARPEAICSSIADV